MSDKRRLRGALRELAHLTPDPESTNRVIAATRTAIAQTSSHHSSNHWREIMRRPKFAIPLAAALIAVVVCSILFFGDPLRNVAFAQVIDKAERAKTVQYLETRSHIARAGEPKGPTEVTKIIILGRSRERKEIISATDGDPLPEGAMWSKAPVGVIMISDLARGKIVSLDTKNKLFSEVKGFLSISPDDGKITKSEVKAAPEVNFYARMREFPADTAEKLAEKEIAGKKAVGFRTKEKIERKRGIDTWTRTYWVNPKTSLPVQVEVTMESTDPHHGQSRWVLSDIVFDAPIDESLLSTDPPAGYTVRSE